MFKKGLIGFSLIMIILIITTGFVFAEENATQMQSIGESPEDVILESLDTCCQNEIEEEVELASEPQMLNDSNAEFYVQDRILANTSLYIEYENPNNVDGYVLGYVDGEYAGSISLYKGSDFNWTRFPLTSSLPLGNHTLNLVFEGDDHFKSFNRTYEFEIVSSVHISGTDNYSDIELALSNESLANSYVRVRYSNADYFVGSIAVYIDEMYCDTLDILTASSGSDWVDSSQNLSLGKHTCNLVFAGNRYCAPFNRTFEFEVVNVIFYFDELMYDLDYISVFLAKNATGEVTIKINGSDKKYNASEGNVNYPVCGMGYGRHNVEVTYSGNYGYKTMAKNVTVDYPMSLEISDDEIDVHFEYYQYGEMTVLIDGRDINYDKYDVDIPEDEPGFAYLPAPIDLTRYHLSKGNHTVELRYSGDDIRPAKSVKETFYIKNSKLDLDKNIDLFVNSGYPIELWFGENTTGNLSVYTSGDGENYTFIDCVSIANNTAGVNVAFTKAGTNYLKVIYNTNGGNDEFIEKCKVYDFKVKRWKIDVAGIYGYDSKNAILNSNSIDTIFFQYGEGVIGNVSIYVEDSNSSVLFTKQQLIEGGRMNISMPQRGYLKHAGNYLIKVVWNTNYGSGTSYYSDIEVIDWTEIVPLSIENLTVNYGENATFSVMIYWDYESPVGENVTVTFEIGEQTFNAKTNRNGIATLNIPNNLTQGNYAIKVICNSKTYEQPLAVKRILSNFTIDFYDDYFVDGDTNIFGFLMPKDIENNVSVEIDGKAYDYEIYDIDNLDLWVWGGDAKTQRGYMVKFSDLSPKNHKVIITYPGDAKYVQNSLEKTITVHAKQVDIVKLQSKLSATGFTANYNGGRNLVATLRDENGNPIKDAEIQIKINNNIQKLKTNNRGQVSLTTNKWIPKSYIVAFNYAGNGSFTASSVKAKVIIKKLTPKLIASKRIFKKSLKTKKYTVTLKTNNNRVMKNAWIILKVNKKTYKAKTNYRGQVTFKITNLNKKGTFTAVVSYAGSTYYNAKTIKPKLIVK